MKVQGLFVLGMVALSEADTSFQIDTCEDLQAAAEATSSDYVVGELTSGGVTCDEWTTFEIDHNRLKLVAPDSATSEDVFYFSGVRFQVGRSGILRVLPKVNFTGPEGTSQPVNGGVLNIEDGGRVRFKSSVSMQDVEVRSLPEPGNPDVPIGQWDGGCIYNEGILRADDGVELANCEVDAAGEGAPGDGSGIWNGTSGRIVIKGKSNMEECGSREIDGNRGGAIFNLGKISIFDDAAFTLNISSTGGAIYNLGTFKFLKNSKATFTGNRSSDTPGGAVFNGAPGILYFNGGATFTDQSTESSAGAIFNGATLRIKESASFIDNRANGSGGAIFNSAGADLDLPDDTVFDGNAVTSSFGDCDDIYNATGPDADDFECLP